MYILPSMVKLWLLVCLLQVIASNCSPISLCSVDDVYNIKNVYLTTVANLSILENDEIPSSEQSQGLLDEYQSKIQNLILNFIAQVDEVKNPNKENPPCLIMLENAALIIQQKLKTKLLSKHLKICEKIVSIQAKYESKTSETKLKTNKAIEKCSLSSSSCDVIENCCNVAIQKLNLLKFDILESLQKLKLKNEEILGEVYEDAVDNTVRLENQLAICLPPSLKTTTSQPVTQETVITDSEVTVQTDKSDEDSSEESNESNSTEDPETTSDSNDVEEETTIQQNDSDETEESTSEINSSVESNETKEECGSINDNSNPVEEYRNAEAQNADADQSSNCEYVSQELV